MDRPGAMVPVKVQDERDALLGIVRDLVDPSECRWDHHGYCQAHGWLDDIECPHARAKKLLPVIEERQRKGRS